MAALSTAPNAAAGGKSTTRKIEPRGGGATPISRAARSALPDTSAGDSSVTHRERRGEAGRLSQLRVERHAPSIRTTAFPFASWPVTTRRVGCAIPWRVRRLQPAKERKGNFRSACDIAAAFRVETPQ
jgi:hypothetical protein